MTTEEMSAIVEKNGSTRGELISILEKIQSKYSYLPEDVLRDVAEKTGYSLVDIYGIATFYRAFSLEPPSSNFPLSVIGRKVSRRLDYGQKKIAILR